MAHPKIIVVFFTLLTFEISVTVALNKEVKKFRHHNEQCILYDHAEKCDSSQGLMCLDAGLKGYRCLCPSNHLHAQSFDMKRNACVGKAFNACVRGNSRSTMNETLCVENSECNTAVYGLPICLCKAGYVAKDDGSCVPSLKYGDYCNSGENKTNGTSDDESTSSTSKSDKCDEIHGQACIDGKCQCKYPSEQYYDSKVQKCISYAGGRCAFDKQVYSCVPNANCPAPPVKVNSNPMRLPPFLGGLMDDGDEVFEMHMRPRPQFPMPPLPHHHRPHPFHHHNLPLLSKQDPMIDFDTRFDNYDIVARSIIFGPDGGSKKEDGGETSADTNSNQPRCQCLPEYSRTADGLCMKGYGSTCNPDDDDGHSSSNSSRGGVRELCNPDQFLECLDAYDGTFKCQCRNPLNERYDPFMKQCVSRVGRLCRPLGNYAKCDKGAECIQGVCQCTNGTSVTPMDTCALDYNEKCEPGECNVHRGLQCHGKSKTCMCLDSYLRYDHKKGACLASKHSPCGPVGFAISSGSFAPEMAYIECEEGLECKERKVAGKNVLSVCM